MQAISLKRKSKPCNIIFQIMKFVSYFFTILTIKHFNHSCWIKVKTLKSKAVVFKGQLPLPLALTAAIPRSLLPLTPL